MNVLLLETQFYLSLARHTSLIVCASVLPECSLLPVKAKAWVFYISCSSALQA